MFAKLLKYEFKATGKPLIWGGLAAILAGVAGSLTLHFLIGQTESSSENAEVLFIILGFLLLGIFFTLMAYMIAPTVLVLYRFYKHHFSDEGYLTFTVPATTHQILSASIVNFLLCGLISGIFALLSFVIIFIPLVQQVQSNADYATLFQISGAEYGLGTSISIILMIVSNLVYSLIMPFLSITIGSLIAKKHKILCAIAVGYGINMLISTVSGIGTSIVSVSSFVNDAAYVSAMNTSILVPSLLYLAFGVGGYFLMHRLIKYNLNI